MVTSSKAAELQQKCILEEGRSVVAEIPSFVKGGVIVVSTYLRHSEGWSETNTRSANMVA